VPVKIRSNLTPAGVTRAAFRNVIVIRRGSNQLELFNYQRLRKRFRVATGEAVYPTPLGRFRIVVMWRNPWWYPPNSRWARGLKPVPPGPNNPLGTRWMGLSASGVGIHGTPNSGSIGYSVSHGCIRMHIPDAEWLFGVVEVGTPVFIVSA
jgi:lipoprotein-anchoring transpeptidase ErfK/SrfK